MSIENKKTILLVEDEPIITLIQTRILSNNAYIVISANSGEDAIEKVRSYPEINLILMDINLGPGIDGTEAAEIILKDYDIPLVFLSSHTEPEIVEKTEGITSYGYIVKNSGETVLLASIKMAFRLFEAKIKEREREEALIYSENRYRSLFDNISSGVAIFEPSSGGSKFIVKDMNKAGEIATKKSKQEVIGKLAEEAFPGIIDLGLCDVLKKVWETGESETLPVLKYEDNLIHAYFENFVYKLPSGEIVSVFNDYTEKKQIEESLIIEKTLMESVFNSVPGLLYLYDIEGHLIRWNKNHEIMTGYSSEELKNFHILDWYKYDPNCVEMINQSVEPLMKNGFADIEVNLQKKDGSLIPLYLTASLVTINGKQYFTGFGIDISERIKNQEALIENEAHFRTLADSGESLIWTSETNKKCNYFNIPWLNFTGKTLEQEKGDGWAEGIHPEDYNYCLETYNQAFDRREPFSMEYRIRHHSGEYRWIQDKGTPRYNTKGEFLGYIGHCWDITSMKETQKKLIEREQYLSRILDTSKDGIWIFNTNGNLIDVNNYYCDLIGYSKEEILKMNINDIDAIEDQEITMKRIQRVMTTGFEFFTTKHRKKNGDLIDIEISSSFIDQNDGQFICFCRDISERIKWEESLQENEHLLRKYLNNAPYGIFVVNSEGKFIECNPYASQMVQYQPDKILKMSIPDIVYPGFEEEALNHFYTVKEKGHALGEIAMRRADGCKRYWSINAVSINDNCFISFCNDITEEKETQSLLKEKTELLQHMIDNMFDFISITDLEGNFTFIGKSHGILGYDFDSMIGKNAFDFVHPDDRPKMLPLFENCIKTGLAQKGEYRKLLPDGSYLWIESIGKTIQDEHGVVNRILFNSRDISERKIIDSALEESEELFRNLFLYHSAIKFILNPETGNIIDANYSAAEYYGWSRDELRQMNINQINILPVDKILEEMDKAKSQQKNYFNFKHKKANGVIRDVEVFSSRIEVKGQVLIHSIVHDITERKKAEDELILTQKKLKEAMLIANLVQWEYDIANDLFTFNDDFYTLYGTTAKKEGGYQMNSEEYVKRFVYHEDVPYIIHVMKEANENLDGRIHRLEHRMIRRDHQIRYISVSYFSEADGQNNYTKRFGANQDITLRKQAELQIRNLLNERELLLKEVHHRVKNNMNAIYSMLQLQSFDQKDQTLKSILNDSASRIQSMMVLYDKLYHFETYSQLNLRIFYPQLLQEIVSSFYNLKDIHTSIEIDDILLTSKVLFPLGIILNELVTNSMKYAFKKDRLNKILLSAIKNDQEICITYQDNGTDFDPNFDIQKSSGFGMQLIRILVEQLKGSISIVKSQGAHFIIKFKIEE